MLFGSKKSASENLLLERYRSLMEGLEEAVIVYTSDFKIVEFNKAAEKMLGLSKADVLDKTFDPSFANQAKYALFIQTLFPSLAPSIVNKSEPGVFPQISEISFPEAKLNLRVMTVPIEKTSSGMIFAKIISDETYAVELGQAKSEFINIAAHQLRAPITSISWVFEILKDEAGVSPESADAIRQGLKESQRLSKIVTDLFDAARIEEGALHYEMQSQDIIGFVGQIVDGVKNYIAEAQLKIKISFEHSEPQIVLNYDPEKLGLALTKILDNAVKYNIENGEVSVKIEKLADRPYVEIKISDTGIGIPSDKLAFVSTRFFKADNVDKRMNDGTGLGLYITKHIIKKHGGNMEIESVLGRGTTVKILLPSEKLSPHA